MNKRFDHLNFILPTKKKKTFILILFNEKRRKIFGYYLLKNLFIYLLYFILKLENYKLFKISQK